MTFDKYKQAGAYHWLECDPRNGLIYNPALEARYKIVLDYVKQATSPGQVLDVGAGDGFLMAQLQHHARHVVGIEPEAQGVAVAQQMLSRLGRTSLVRGDGYQLPFAIGSFDVVILTDVFEHLHRPQDCLKEIARVLKPQGFFIMTTPQYSAERLPDVYHVKEYRPDELIAEVSICFADIDIVYFWPDSWYRFYETAIGWRLIKEMARLGYNPLLQSSGCCAEKYAQMMLIGRSPQNQGNR